MRTLILLCFALIAALAQPPADAPKPQRPMREPTNLKVLKLPAAELIPVMRSFNASLGIKCDHCHVQGNFASDDNHHKDIARKMITMTAQINSNFPDGKNHVTCYTCHRGQTEPVTEVPAGPPAEKK